MKPQEKQIDTKEYLELYKHPGSENYEIRTIVPKKNIAKYFLVDSILKNIIVDSYFENADKKKITYEALKMDLLGNISDTHESFSTFPDGTMKGFDFYSNWIINGDTTRHRYIDPFTGKKIDDPYDYKNSETNFEKWQKKFDELYSKTSYVYRDGGFYYLKGANNEWYFMKAKFKDKPDDFSKRYPAKEDQDVRMVDLKDQFPDLYLPPAERDTSLIKQIKYTSTFFEKSDRGDSFNYSAGWWYFDIYMPGGDTLKIKRFASFRDPEMKLYKIPKELGGRDDVLFIIQEPNEIHPEQTGGMYVIRSKNYKETPQYKEQQEKQQEMEKKKKQKESQEAVKKRRNFLPEE